ncbi:hypothetical protein GCM10017621_07540 [Maricaulis virginensis]|uniref:Uncharacterized protein n=1 Tax=Maricaulis virginensis TaxID=144022 RepID=A0A9W6ILN4_9PROT|nr:hypothetical protein GCM10017621_07540 [Maricaulis virginensis]
MVFLPSGLASILAQVLRAGLVVLAMDHMVRPALELAAGGNVVGLDTAAALANSLAARPSA